MMSLCGCESITSVEHCVGNNRNSIKLMKRSRVILKAASSVSSAVTVAELASLTEVIKGEWTAAQDCSTNH